jgi:uncharacterized membrane protein
MDAILQSPFISGTLTPEWSFLGIELLVYLFVFLCARDALTSKTLEAKDRPRWLSVMGFAFLFTLVIEMLMSHSEIMTGNPPVQHRLYSYPAKSFLLQIFEVPVWVPLGWCFILYATMRTTTLLGMKWYTAPLLDGFLALNLDLTLDPIAINRGWWAWNVMDDPSSQYLSSYFGIPLVNFMGWYVIVASFSFFSRWLWQRADKKNTNTNPALMSLGATVLSLPAVVIYQTIGTKLMGQESANPSLFANGMLITTMVWAVCLAVILREAPSFRRDQHINPTLVAVPWVFHLYCFILLWMTRARVPPAQNTNWLVHESSELAIFMPIAALFGLGLYYWPYLEELGKPRALRGKTT